MKNQSQTETWKCFKRSSPRGSSIVKYWEISNLGNVRITNSENDFIRHPKTYESGGHATTGRYLCLASNDFKYIHRIVAQQFLDNPGDLPTVDHINGIKTDNRVENLRWCSYEEQMSNITKLKANGIAKRNN